MKMKNKIIFMIIITITILCSLSTVYAGDNLYHFMQAHQDYIVIGKIVDKKSKNKCTIEVAELIQDSSIRKDISKIINVNPDSFLENFETGDNIAISLSKRGGGYQLENGAFKITTNNTDTLETIDFEKAYQPNELSAIELFLKSRGKIKDFYFVEDKTYVHSEPFKITEEDICIYSEKTGKVLPQEFEKNDKYIVATSNKNSLKIVIVAIVIFILSQVVVLFAYTKMNPDTKLKEIFKKKRTRGHTSCPQKVKCLKEILKVKVPKEKCKSTHSL